MAEWSKACGSGPHLSGGVSSNLTSFNHFFSLFWFYVILKIKKLRVQIFLAKFQNRRKKELVNIS